MHVVPEFPKAGESQALVGDPARAVIDHENEPASQQQQSHQTEKPADHASPCRLLPDAIGLTGGAGKFNRASTLRGSCRTPAHQPESVDAARPALYKTGQ